MYGIPNDIDWSFFVGTEVQQIRIGTHDVQIHLFKDISIAMGDCFEHLSEGRALSHELELSRKAITLVSLLGARVENVSIEAGKVLILTFSNQDILKLYDDRDRFECFTVTGPGLTIAI